MSEAAAPSVRNRKPPGVRREQILAVATEMFGNAGFRGVSLADIAARVGISQPGLIHHFHTKEELLIAALERRDKESSGHIEDAFRDLSAVDALLSLCRHNMEYPESIRLYAVESAESLEPGHPAREFFLSRYTRVRKAVAERARRDQQQGRLPAEMDPWTFAAGVIALMDGLQVQWLLDPSFDMSAVLALYLEQFRVTEGAASE
ncbi:AcrR family transcriptional regulator [Kibdelosporangium banguiense]|uniref:AcrR family transcriptional regulator n=1 Tax=Kibdelosporangium banguiense TaxID=1365924 RepID=A0ABS4TR96_9PSEU|nr:TetR/AcrR family transcriptional regulator [Kibdelosporangium banguiense]MBP2326942.1 AcrR family transcriptional regulator [Kibdelosporangium banguiense]